MNPAVRIAGDQPGAEDRVENGVDFPRVFCGHNGSRAFQPDPAESFNQGDQEYE